MVSAGKISTLIVSNAPFSKADIMTMGGIVAEMEYEPPLGCISVAR
jgi:hypothetical protein